MMRLSVVVPTISRPGLLFTLASLASQLRPEDEILVSSDGPLQPWALRMSEEYGARVLENPKVGDWGGAARNAAILVAKGTHVAFLDDDDWWRPGARDCVLDEPVPVIYKMRYPSGRELWRTKDLVEGNVGTPMIVVPNEPAKLGKWTERRECDFDFIASCKWPRVEWSGDVLALLGHNDGE